MSFVAMTSVKCIDYTSVNSDVYCVRPFSRVYTRRLQSLASGEKEMDTERLLCKNPGLTLKTHFVEMSFVIMIPTSCYVHFY